MYEVRKINILTFAKYSAIMAAVASLLPMIFWLVIFLITSFRFSYYSRYEWWLLIWILIIPLVTAVVGFLGGLLTAYVYNLLAPRIGGVKIELVYLEEDKSGEK